MSLGGRSYSDPSYGSKKTLELPVSEVLAGTGTAVDIGAEVKVMYPMTVRDWQYTVTTAGTGAAPGSVILGYKLAGTGAFTAIGTAATSGTQAIDGIVSGAATSTNIAADDTLSLILDGTAQDITVVKPRVEVIERFVQSDS